MAIILTPEELASQSLEMMNLKNQYESMFQNVSGILNDVNQNWSANLANNFAGKISAAQNSFSNLANMLQTGSDAANKSAATFSTLENQLISLFSGDGSPVYMSSKENTTVTVSGDVKSDIRKELERKHKIFSDEFWSNYGWKEILSGAGYIDTIYNLISNIKNGKTWRDFAKTGVDAYQFLSGAAKTYNNYKKIGNAVGTKTAMAWWAKNITGLKPLGRASTAKNPLTRFANNLTNKTSPFSAQFKNVINNFTGANGVGKAVASWGAVAVNGVLNWFSNKEEQANSNGTMSDGRVIAETITETAVDTVLTYGTGIVVGAAVTAALGTVAAPGVVVVAASGAVVAGVNAGVKTLTGKTTTEWISDTILDSGETISNAVSNAAKNVSESIGSWFGKLSFT